MHGGGSEKVLGVMKGEMENTDNRPGYYKEFIECGYSYISTTHCSSSD